jgi:hypothetical protein
VWILLVKLQEWQIGSNSLFQWSREPSALKTFIEVSLDLHKAFTIFAQLVKLQGAGKLDAGRRSKPDGIAIRIRCLKRLS